MQVTLLTIRRAQLSSRKAMAMAMAVTEAQKKRRGDV